MGVETLQWSRNAEGRGNGDKATIAAYVRGGEIPRTVVLRRKDNIGRQEA